ncbi:hypothetical protein [Parasulfitobacter algicola]|uniref:Uncharacterized protein n=1 Tax=Parasulfitobacter algicola TaxID=2614809 RepID=A0ABX2IQQ2_9RHOB|nr:hypothetical protein [Sulfitobacter algicola]NSX55204.1 hypothetical protein [Sulfitobacter algicola]
MKDIDALQSRIISAMDRISKGLDKIGSEANNTAVEEELDAQKASNIKLSQELTALRKALKKSEDANPTGSEDQQKVLDLETEVKELRQANQKLKDLQSADRAELDAILAELKTVVKEKI